MPTVTSLSDTFNSWWNRTEEDAIEGSKRAGYPFIVKLVVSRNIPPRDSRFDFILDMGKNLIGDIFGKKEIPMEGSQLFVFPERYMSVHEQQSFMCELVKHKKIKKLKEVCIITSSPLMVSDFCNENITIISSDEYMGG